MDVVISSSDTAEAKQLIQLLSRTDNFTKRIFLSYMQGFEAGQQAESEKEVPENTEA